MSEKEIIEGVAGVVRTYELLDRVRTRQDLVIRDDQFGFTALLDAARYAARRRIRLSLLDTGRFGLDEIESLARSGARILTTDEARPRLEDWDILQAACRDGGTRLAVFWNAALPDPAAGAAAAAQTLEDLLAGGIDFHISDRARPRDADGLAALAAAARKGRGVVVIYNTGPLADGLAGPAGNGAWVHFGDAAILDRAAAARAVEIAAAARRAGSRAAVHIEQGLELELLEALWAAGAALLFRTAPSDDRSLLRPLELKAARRKLPARAFWLSTAFLP